MALFEFHFHCDGGKLEELLSLVKKGFADMAQIRQDIADLTAKFDAATTAIANRIDALVQASAGLTADEKAAFQAEIDRLNVLGSDPNNPIPPTV